MVVLNALKFVCHCLGLVGAGCAVTARPPHAVHMAVYCTVNHAATLGRSSHLGLAKAGHSEPLALCPTAPPRTAVWVPPRQRCAVITSALPALLTSQRCYCRLIVIAFALIRCTSVLLLAL